MYKCSASFGAVDPGADVGLHLGHAIRCFFAFVVSAKRITRRPTGSIDRGLSSQSRRSVSPSLPAARIRNLDSRSSTSPRKDGGSQRAAAARSRRRTSSSSPAANHRNPKWKFTKVDDDWFCFAGLWRPMPDGAGDAFTLLTTEPIPTRRRYTTGKWSSPTGRIGLPGSISAAPNPSCCARCPRGASPSNRCDNIRLRKGQVAR